MIDPIFLSVLVPSKCGLSPHNCLLSDPSRTLKILILTYYVFMFLHLICFSILAYRIMHAYNVA